MNKEETIANIKVLEEHMAHLLEHLEITAALCKQRELAYHQTRTAHLRLRAEYQRLDMQRALLSKSTTKHITVAHVSKRIKEEQNAMSIKQLNAATDKMSAEDAASLLEKLRTMMNSQ